MKRSVVVLTIIIMAFFVGSFLFLPRKKGQPTVKIGNVTVSVEIARTREERSRGLSYRKELPQDQGMLFVFPEKSYQTFWMKGMNFDLDFIWIVDNKVIDITENVSAPQGNIPDEALPLYRSKVPVESMLEVNSGFVVNNKIKIGDTVVLNLKDK